MNSATESPIVDNLLIYSCKLNSSTGWESGISANKHLAGNFVDLWWIILLLFLVSKKLAVSTSAKNPPLFWKSPLPTKLYWEVSPS